MYKRQGKLYDASQMNDRDAVADETHHREIMTDEQIGPVSYTHLDVYKRQDLLYH